MYFLLQFRRSRSSLVQVELLKKNLVETLKHATNIEALKSDESVILTVTGKAITSTTVVNRGKSAKWIFRSDRWVPLTDESRTASYPMLAPSVLTIRAKKSDIDALSKGELEFNEFYERIQLLANWSGSTSTISNITGFRCVRTVNAELARYIDRLAGQ